MAGILNDYISRGSFHLPSELHNLMKKYREKTSRDLFIYAADIESNKGANVSLNQNDFYVIQDMLRNEKFENIDFYLETPGGNGVTAEEIARFLHNKFKEVRFIIAGEAKSAGTILVLSGDDIFMTDSGSLGPIDAQIQIGRSTVSAFDYLKWIEDKRKEALTNGRLSIVDTIILAQISPGELEKVNNSLEFAKDLVKVWLPKYKFKNWNETETEKKKVTEDYKRQRASEVAEMLTNQTDFRTHGRSLKIEDLNDKLRIHRIDDDPELSDIVYRIKMIIRLLFDSSSTYKIFFTENEKITRTVAVSNQLGLVSNPTGLPNNISPKSVNSGKIEVTCNKCGKRHPIEFSSSPLKKQQTEGLDVKTNKLTCDKCRFIIDLTPIKADLELKLMKKIYF